MGFLGLSTDQLLIVVSIFGAFFMLNWMVGGRVFEWIALRTGVQRPSLAKSRHGLAYKYHGYPKSITHIQIIPKTPIEVDGKYINDDELIFYDGLADRYKIVKWRSLEVPPTILSIHDMVLLEDKPDVLGEILDENKELKRRVDVKDAEANSAWANTFNTIDKLGTHNKEWRKDFGGMMQQSNYRSNRLNTAQDRGGQDTEGGEDG